jgi:3-hydroxyacyl-[acyl-carrier-protein] dehydratase
MTIKPIYQMLPHRFEWELLTKILEVKALESATTKLEALKGSWYFRGHFPDYQIVPGVILIEAMAHTAGLIFKVSPEYQDSLGVLAGINKAKFRISVKPGDSVTLIAKLKNMKANLAIIETKALVLDKIVAEAELLVGLAKK